MNTFRVMLPLMAAPTTTLYRFQIELSDIDRSVYETLDFRVAQHPSESLPYLLTRVLAFALNAQEGLEFSPQGLGDPDAAALRVAHPNGGVNLWIEIGNPAARKLHKAAKASRAVKVYTYKDPAVLLREIQGHDVHRANEIELYSLASGFLENLADRLKKDNRWTLVHDAGSLMITLDGHVEQGELHRHVLNVF